MGWEAGSRKGVMVLREEIDICLIHFSSPSIPRQRYFRPHGSGSGRIMLLLPSYRLMFTRVTDDKEQHLAVKDTNKRTERAGQRGL